MYKCDFCETTFSKSSNLKLHQRRARYCLQKQVSTYKCICSCEVVGILNYNDHIKHCINYKAFSLEKENQILTEKLREKEEHIKKLEANITVLQNKLENIALQSVKRPTVSNTNNIITLQPLTQEWLQSQASLLNRSHVEKGIAGYALFAKNYSFKDRVKCLDFSRKKLQFLEEDGTVIKDNKGNRICKMFFDSIKNENEEIVDEIQAEILKQVAETCNPAETMSLFERMNEIVKISRGIKKVSQGESDALKDDFVKELCNLLEK